MKANKATIYYGDTLVIDFTSTKMSRNLHRDVEVTIKNGEAFVNAVKHYIEFIIDDIYDPKIISSVLPQYVTEEKATKKTWLRKARPARKKIIRGLVEFKKNEKLSIRTNNYRIITENDGISKNQNL